MAATRTAVASGVQIRPAARLGVPSLAPVQPLGCRPSTVARRFPAPARAEKKTSFDTKEIISNLTDKWEETDDKSTVIVIGGGIIAALWVTSSLVGAVNTLPLLPKFLELVGLVYTSWFVYRYLLFKSSREELISDIDDLKKKISGDS